MNSGTFTEGIENPVVDWLNPADEADWDAFVGRHPLGLVYHLSAWKRLMEEAFPHIQGRFLVLRDDGNGEIHAGLPIYTVKSWLLGNRLVSVPFASFCDPLVSSSYEFREFLPLIQNACTQNRCRDLSVRARRTLPYFKAALETPSSTYKHNYLPLDKGPTALFASFAKSSICQKVTKASKAGVTVVEVDAADSMKTCHTILGHTRRKVSLPPFPLSFFSAMQRTLAPDHLKVFLAIHQGKTVGCHLILTYKDLWISEYSGNVQDAMHGVNQLLYWETIKRAYESGAHMFSFGRTASSNQGLLDYKRRWATIEEDCGDFPLPQLAKETVPGASHPGQNREDGLQYRALRYVVRRAPAPLCDMIGKFCYRHLG